ncbi:hypothetical protein Ae406Ps2_2334 [Pseudonocardia sp. Ae406_Ps2]|nr:hypothetical protein Ae331Ps2_3587c [Pseudonocardia sp. Ae331_Ps2]OLM02334.1 hypothetical protein Ae406Ps2_2334 [Pseudonocardia sp. Ae406_Ps2]OLM12831.1 hypothetical protein Ae505Ps2_2959c [Pseudonocardia sp. Ae505_Ps2]OLM23906.1 hypothetical protein Ae706Ps2_2339 [Pseudonocardia sp. Ae706_Ps2]
MIAVWWVEQTRRARDGDTGGTAGHRRAASRR